MSRLILLIGALLLAPVPVYAHSGGFGLNIFGVPSEINNLIWGTLLTAVVILSLFALSRFAEKRVRQAARTPEAPRRRSVER